MSIPFSELVDVQPRTIGGGYNSLEFNGVLLSRSAELPVGVAKSFASAKDVEKYFGASSIENALAIKYFAGNTVSIRVPSTLFIYRNVNEDANAWLRGAEYTGTLEDIKAITSGSLTITINGEEQIASNIDLSAVTSFSGVGEKITLNNASLVYDSLHSAFKVVTTEAGADVSVSYATGVVAELLGLTQAQGAIISEGRQAETVTKSLNDLTDVELNFVSFMPAWNETEEEAMEMANWCNAQGTRFVYAYTELNPNVEVLTSGTFAQSVSAMYGIACQYGEKGLSSALMGFIASIAWDETGGRMTMAFRQQGGLTASVTKTTVARNLLSNGYNFYGSYANPNNNDNFFQNGQISGMARWIDTYCGQIYLCNQLQIGWVNVMKNSNVIPYNQQGYSVLRANALDVILQAVANGVIVRGVSLSNSQIQECAKEAGLDISTELQTQGYYLQILDPSAEVRANRGTPIIKLWYTDGGSVQKINATATTIL